MKLLKLTHKMNDFAKPRLFCTAGLLVDWTVDIRWAFIFSACLTFISSLLHVPLIRNQQMAHNSDKGNKAENESNTVV